MKKVLSIFVSALVAISFAGIVMAAETVKPVTDAAAPVADAAKTTDKKEVKKEKKDVKKEVKKDGEA